jgi:hypothetical protein
MKKALLTLSVCYACLLMIAASAHAEAGDRTFADSSFADSCHLTIDSHVTMDAENILVTANNGDRLLLKGDNQLLVNDSPITINSRQQLLVDEYRRQLRTTIPAVVDIALEAVDIGLTAVSDVFSALVGTEPPADLRLALNNFRAEINARMAHQGQVVRLDGNSADLSGPAFDKITADLQTSLESAMASSIGTIIMGLGQSIEAGEGSLDERIKGFAQRFERLGEELEAKVKSRTGALEERASGLCDQMAELQAAEQNLQAEVPGLQAFSLIYPNTQGTSI